MLYVPEIPCGTRCVICDKTPLRMDLDTTWQDPASPASFVFHPIAHVPYHKIWCRAWDTKQKSRYHPGRNRVQAEWFSQYRRAFRQDNRTAKKSRREFRPVSIAARLHGFVPRVFLYPSHQGFFEIQTRRPSI